MTNTQTAYMSLCEDIRHCCFEATEQEVLVIAQLLEETNSGVIDEEYARTRLSLIREIASKEARKLAHFASFVNSEVEAV